jgi:hypothetical protein
MSAGRRLRGIGRLNMRGNGVIRGERQGERKRKSNNGGERMMGRRRDDKVERILL